MTRPLLSRPDANTFAIEDLIKWMEEGRVRIPHFQRPLRWTGKHVLDLFDSIAQGYPLGNLLFWKRAADVGEPFRIGSLSLPAPAHPSALFVVDGQQRLCTLAGVLLHRTGGFSPTDVYALWFNPDNQGFVRPRRAEEIEAHFVPMNVVVDSVALGVWERKHGGLTEAQYRAALEIGKRIRETRIPAYTVESDDIEALKVIFTRLNSAGVEMRQTEVFAALHAEEGAENGLQRLARVCAEAGMGKLDEALALKVLRVIAGDPLDTPMKGEVGAYAAVVPQATMALASALDFLRQAGIPHLRLLPGQLPLIVLTAFLSGTPQPHPRTRQLLRRWLWRGFLSGTHFDSQSPHWRALHRALQPSAEADRIAALLTDAGHPSESEINRWATAIARTEKNFGSAELKMQGALLAALQPRSLDTGDICDVSNLMELSGAQALQKVSGSNCRVLTAWRDDLEADLDGASGDVRASHGWVVPHSEREEHMTMQFAKRLMVWCEPSQSDHLALPSDEETEP